MEPVALVVDQLKGFAQDFANGILHRFQSSDRRNQIEILKRLQREAFSDIMKLRDRQDKVERLLSFKSSKGSPFVEATTRVRGEVEFLGLLFHEENQGTIHQMGITSGVSSRFTFETTVRQKDTLTAELAASALPTPLSLSKVLYAANISDCFSLVGVPVGARCRDVGPTRSSRQVRGCTSYSFGGPPLLNQHVGSGIGLTVRKSNVIGTLAHFVSPLDSPHCLTTFGQVIYQLSTNTKLLLLGLHQSHKFSSQHVSLGQHASFGSTALILESELDESTRIGGWVEMNNSNTRHIQWAVCISDVPEDDLGWGLGLGGWVQGPKKAEAFSNINLGDKFSLQPTLVYVKDGTTRFPAFMLKSSWSF